MSLQFRFVKRTITRLFLGLSLVCFAGLAAPDEARPQSVPVGADAAVKHVEAESAAKLLKERPEVVVLDIRTPDEFKTGHIAGAKNIDFNSANFAKELEKLDKSKTYLVHCASGRRSTKSLETFKDLKFQSICHLDGGIKGWQKAGQPVTKNGK